MRLSLVCPHCNEPLTAGAGWAGRAIRCPACDRVLVVPELPGVQRRARDEARCPCCGSDAPPLVRRQLSQGGRLFFWTFLILFFPICWVGLLSRELCHVCADCGTRLD